MNIFILIYDLLKLTQSNNYLSRCFTDVNLKESDPLMFDKRVIVRVNKKWVEDELVMLDDLEPQDGSEYFLLLYTYYLITFTLPIFKLCYGN